MNQISPPLRILLVGAIVFMGAWMTVLKPKTGEDVPLPTAASVAAPPTAASGQPGAPPALTKPGQVAAEAQKAADTAGQAASARAGEAPASAPAGSSSSASKPGVTPVTGGVAPPAATEADRKAVKDAALPKAVAKAIAGKKTLVLFFWNSKAADDRAVRKALKGVDRHRGKVAVHVASIKDISRYAPITRGVDVSQSPSIVVVDKRLQAELLTGYVDRVSINQAISDALRVK